MSFTSFSSAANPNVVKTALDAVVYTEYERKQSPQTARASDTCLFNQETSDRAAEIMEVFAGVGEFETRSEEQDVPNQAPSVADQKVFTMVEYAKGTDIPKRYVDDELWGTMKMMVKDYGRKARVTQDKAAMAVYRGGFATETTVDGAFVFSNTHTNRNGDTIDNLETAALNDDSLDTLINRLQEQKDQAGVISGMEPACLLVPVAEFKQASIILDTELRSGTGNNDTNVYSSKYDIMLKKSPYLGAAAGGSNTAHFLVADGHNVMRYVREGFSTAMSSWEESRNRSYFYQAAFREEVGAVTYEGLVGSIGTT